MPQAVSSDPKPSVRVSPVLLPIALYAVAFSLVVVGVLTLLTQKGLGLGLILGGFVLSVVSAALVRPARKGPANDSLHREGGS